jgi:hypothetical protein
VQKPGPVVLRSRRLRADDVITINADDDGAASVRVA